MITNFCRQAIARCGSQNKCSVIAQSLNASKAGRVYFTPTYLWAGLSGPIGTELYLEELKEQLLEPN